MIGFFPDPYPDELIYSVCARFQERMGYLSSSSTFRELFGSADYTINIALPHHLNNLISALPPGHHYTVDRLINEHTLLPFFSPFLEPERVTSLREGRWEDNGTRLGIRTSNIRLPDWFRFCPLCAKEDKKQLGEFYWHRLHQLPDVKVCHVHNIFLENSKAPLQSLGTKKLLSAEQAVTAQFSYLLDASNPCHEGLLKIARDADWLLGQPNLVLRPKFTQNRYLYLLEKRGLAKYYIGVRVRELLQAFRNYYPPDFLKLLNCELDYQDRYSWLFRLVRTSISWAQPALHHLLLIQFLGYTAEEFFTMPEESSLLTEEPSPFGEGPWPCLNPACEYFRLPQIEEITDIYREGKKLVGTFGCACGFVYSRNGPDQSPENRFRFNRVESYGPLWESALRQLWNDSTISLTEIARQLGSYNIAVKRHASYLGLSFPRQDQTANVEPIQFKDSQISIHKKLETYRSEWLTARREHPEAASSFLNYKFRRIYRWLNTHDKEWLKAHLPPFQSGAKSLITSLSLRVDWESQP